MTEALERVSKGGRLCFERRIRRGTRKDIWTPNVITHDITSSRGGSGTGGGTEEAGFPRVFSLSGFHYSIWWGVTRLDPTSLFRPFFSSPPHLAAAVTVAVATSVSVIP